MLGLTLHLMSGVWAGYSSTPRPITDINGKALVAGDTVKMVGTIVSVDPLGAHFNAVVIKPTHPEGDKNLTGVTFSVDPKQLLYGS